ncbi:MAG: protein O-mannosyl-transferase family [Vicinamibacterales bacterium]
MRTQVTALAVLFLLAHLFLFPPTLEDIDSINFALGVQDFDVARHRPHPPGYPVFIALARVSTSIVHALGTVDPVPPALSLLSAMSGASLVPLLFALYRRFGADDRVAWWAMAAAVCAPLFWFTALRPLSDMTGLAVAVSSQVLLLGAIRPMRGAAVPGSDPTASASDPGSRARARQLIFGALLCGVAAGVRVQTVMLTAPLLVAVLLWPDRGLTLASRLGGLAAVLIGGLLWGVPLLIASGGLSDYLAALGSQADEDFSGVVMLWTTRSPRVAVDAFLYSFAWPWGWLTLGLGVLAAAAVGLVRAAWRLPRSVVLLAIAFGPYAAFHLLFHETATVRYALPLVLPVALLAVYAAAGLGRRGLTLTAGALVAATLVIAAPAARAYSRDGSPAFRAFDAATRSTNTAGVLGMHAGMRRIDDWRGAPPGWRVLRAPHGSEWLALVEHWRREPETAVRFLADPRRTDLALFDPRSRVLEAAERWTFRELPFVAGTRPGATDLYTMRPPGWMLDRGWAVTAEVGGVSAKQGAGPHRAPSIAWVQARTDSALLVVGGRNLSSADGPAGRLTVTGPAGAIDAWDVPPGVFLRRITLPAGALSGSGYLPLRFLAAPADGTAAAVPVSLEQFDLQPEGIPVLAFGEGWGEPEYNPSTSRAWRWMSERATLWVRPVGRDVTLTFAGESPLRYFDRAPMVRIGAGDQEMGSFSPSADFEQSITLPAALLALTGGQVTVTSDLWFTPAARGAADERHLALRMYRVTVD